MAWSDYKICDHCGNAKVFYDANIEDERYQATWGYNPIGLKAICGDCNKTHQVVIAPRVLEPAPDLAELTNPVAVHANMLRGTIAKPTVDHIIHLYGVDALCKALSPVIVQEAGHNPAPDLAELDAAKIIQKRIDAIFQEEGSWEPDTNFTNLPEWAETAVEELEGILAKIKEPQP